MIVYKITCKINNKIYVGQTCETLEQRFKRHMGYQKDESDTKFYRAVRKYGKENFYIEQLDVAETQEELDEKEFYWINKLDTVDNGYNTKATKGKCGGDTLSKHPNKKVISEKIRQSKLGDKNPMRTKGGLKSEKNGMYGKFGELNPYSKKIVALNEDGTLYKVYGSLADARRELNISSSSMITNRLKGRVKSTYKGFSFMYYEDYMKGQETIESIVQEKDLCE